MSLKLGLRNKIRRSRAGGFAGLLDQSFASGATAAYSLRRLKASATKAVRVREDSSNTETDIGFSGGTLDTTALLNHVGSNNGFVTKWYDQSGNGNDASNPTASEQPQIVDGGSVIKENGQPAIETFGELNNFYLATASNINFSLDNLSIFHVYKPTVFRHANRYLTINDQVSFVEASKSFANPQYQVFGDIIGSQYLLSTGQRLATTIFDNTVAKLEMFKDGNLQTSNSGSPINKSVSNGEIVLFNRLSKDQGQGQKLQELLIYAKDKASDRNNIETNINNHYSIF